MGRLRAGFATLALLSAAACGGNPVEAMPPEGMTDTTTPFSCTPGEELDCSCADGRAGKQLCLASGFEVSGCMCSGDPSSTGDDTTSGTDSMDSTASTASTGTSAEASTSTTSDTDEPSEDGGTDESTGKDTGESTGDTSGGTDDTADGSGSTGSAGAADE